MGLSKQAAGLGGAFGIQACGAEFDLPEVCFGYPPVDRDEVYKEIFEQAENFKKYRSEEKG